MKCTPSDGCSDDNDDDYDDDDDDDDGVRACVCVLIPCRRENSDGGRSHAPQDAGAHTALQRAFGSVGWVVLLLLLLRFCVAGLPNRPCTPRVNVCQFMKRSALDAARCPPPGAVV